MLDSLVPPAATPTLPRVAVLLATYQGAGWIEEQMDSVLENYGCDVHVFISDDGSTDDTIDVIQRYPKDRVTVLPGCTTGSAGQNFIRLILDAPWEDFDYVAFCDQDDIWNRNKLERAIRAIRSRGLAAYSANVNAFWENGSRTLIHKAQPIRRMDHLFEAAGPGNTYVLTAESAGWVRSALSRASRSLVAEVSLHDWLVYAIVRQKGGRWFIDPDPAVDYRQHASNVMGYSRSFGAVRRRIRMLLGRWYFGQVRVIARIAGVVGPERDFIENPTISGLRWMLGHHRDFRRNCWEARVLAFALVWYVARGCR